VNDTSVITVFSSELHEYGIVANSRLSCTFS